MKVYILMGDLDKGEKVYAATLNPEIGEKLLQDYIRDYGWYPLGFENHGFWLVEQELTM